jgi:hypothetical protein
MLKETDEVHQYCLCRHVRKRSNKGKAVMPTEQEEEKARLEVWQQGLRKEKDASPLTLQNTSRKTVLIYMGEE